MCVQAAGWSARETLSVVSDGTQWLTRRGWLCTYTGAQGSCGLRLSAAEMNPQREKGSFVVDVPVSEVKSLFSRGMQKRVSHFMQRLSQS